MAINENVAMKNLSNNIRVIMNENGIKTQREFAEMIDVSPTMLCHVMKEKCIPPVYPFFTGIQNEFGYSVDEMLFTDLGGTIEPTLVLSTVKYEGVYQIYYFDERKRFRSGILLVMKQNSMTKAAKVLMLANLERNYADMCYEKAKEEARNGFGEAEYYMKYRVNLGMLYEGEMNLSNEHMYIYLRGCKDNSRMMLTFYREFSMDKFFSGGLGTMATCGEGRTRTPSVRYIGMSRNSLKHPENEISYHLAIKEENGLSNRIDHHKIMTVFEKFRTRIQDTAQFSEYEQIRFASAEIEDLILQEVSKRLTKSVGVTAGQNEDWCDFIKTNVILKTVV